MSSQDTSVSGIAGLGGSLLGLTTLTVIFRFVARRKQKAALQLDDWIMVPAWLCFAGLTALAFYGISQGFMGYSEPHNKELVDAAHPLVEKVSISLDGIAILTFGFSKLSALFFYRRIFCTNPAALFSLITIGLIVLVSLWTAAFFVMTFLVCGPDLERVFQPGNSAKCGLLLTYFEITVISDFILDVLILAVPIPKIWALHTSPKRKLAISGVFMLGLVGLGASCARMVITLHLVTAGRPVDDEDSYQSNTQWAYYVLLEAGLTIIAANMPSLWYYVAGVTPERVLHSVRSFVSIGTQASHGPGKNNNLYPADGSQMPTRKKSAESTSSSSHLAQHKSGSGETYIMADLSESRKDVASAGAGIQVDRSYQLTAEHV